MDNLTMDKKPTTPQDLDPAQAERLHQLRKALGLSVGDMAQRLGLWGANGSDNLRQMERCARPLPGTLQVLLGYMEREGRAWPQSEYRERPALEREILRAVNGQTPLMVRGRPAIGIGVVIRSPDNTTTVEVLFTDTRKPASVDLSEISLPKP